MKDVYEITNKELTSCVGDRAEIHIIKQILNEPGMINLEGYVNVERFAEWFAYDLEDQINAVEGTSEYKDAWDENYAYGAGIAENINEFLESDNESK